jgi:hypothetical protein
MLRRQHCIGLNELFDGGDTGIKTVAVVHRECRSWVKSAVLTLVRPLPVNPEQWTSSDRPGMSQTCQQRPLNKNASIFTIARLLTDQSKLTISHPWQDRGNLIVMGP